MGKKSKRRAKLDFNNKTQNDLPTTEVGPNIERGFKLVLRIMSWIVGISFISVIILPIFTFSLVDALVKFLFFLGLINLIMFAIFEFFAEKIKKFLNKKLS